MAKGTKTTKTERKKGRGDWKGEDAADEMIPIPKKLLAHLEKAVAQAKPLAKVRWGMAQSVALGRLDEGRIYEIINFTCEVELPCPANPGKISDALEIAQEVVESEINAKVEELEEALGD